MGRANVGNLGRLDGCRSDAEPPLASSTAPPCGGRSSVKRAHHAEGAAIHDVGVDHGRSHVFVTEQRLDGADVCARLEEVGREAVAEGVTGSALVELRRPRHFLYGLLHRRLVQVVEDGPARRLFSFSPMRPNKPLVPTALHAAAHRQGVGQRNPGRADWQTACAFDKRQYDLRGRQLIALDMEEHM